MFFERLNPSPLPTITTSPNDSNANSTMSNHHYAKLATTIQQYGHMYYHFVVETLPKLVLLKETLDEDDDVKLLMWGKEHEKMVRYCMHISLSLEQAYHCFLHIHVCVCPHFQDSYIIDNQQLNVCSCVSFMLLLFSIHLVPRSAWN